MEFSSLFENDFEKNEKACEKLLCIYFMSTNI